MKKRHLSMPSFFCPRMREGGLRSLSVMLCGRGLRTTHIHRPHTTYFQLQKYELFLKRQLFLSVFFQSSPFPVSRIELAGLRLGAAPVLPATTLVYGCYYEMYNVPQN